MTEYKVLNTSSKIDINGLTESRTVEETAKEIAKEKLRQVGIDIIDDVSWGTHLCVFYESKEDLIDVLVPYFKAGLENNEFCMWVTSEPLNVEETKSSLRKAIKNLDDYIAKGQIDIVDCSQWYTKSGKFETDKILQGWVEKENQALRMGFDGLRVTGNTSWLEKKDRGKFADYEAMVNNAIGKYRMLAICSYPLDKCHASKIIEVVNNHRFALIKKEGKWVILESSERKRAEEALKESEQKFKAIFDNATDGILLAELESKKFLIGNKTICQKLGYSQEEIKNLGIMDIHSEKDLSYVIDQVEGQAKKRFTLAKDIPVKKRDGSIFYADVNSALITLAGKRYLAGIFRDITERKKAEDALRESELKLREQNLSLEQKTLALKEMIEHIERTKNRMKEDIAINVDETLMPLVEKLKIKEVSPKYIKLLKHHLKELSSSFGRNIRQRSVKLTSREIEICNMVRGGLASKEVSELLNISLQTIEKHRKNIRKKLGISNKKINLTSYLRKI